MTQSQTLDPKLIEALKAGQVKPPVQLDQKLVEALRAGQIQPAQVQQQPVEDKFDQWLPKDTSGMLTNEDLADPTLGQRASEAGKAVGRGFFGSVLTSANQFAKSIGDPTDPGLHALHNPPPVESSFDANGIAADPRFKDLSTTRVGEFAGGAAPYMLGGSLGAPVKALAGAAGIQAALNGYYAHPEADERTRWENALGQGVVAGGVTLMGGPLAKTADLPGFFAAINTESGGALSKALGEAAIGVAQGTGYGMAQGLASEAIADHLFKKPEDRPTFAKAVEDAWHNYGEPSLFLSAAVDGLKLATVKSAMAEQAKKPGEAATATGQQAPAAESAPITGQEPVVPEQQPAQPQSAATAENLPGGGSPEATSPVAAPSPEVKPLTRFQKFRAAVDDNLRPVEQAFGLAGAETNKLGETVAITAERQRRSRTNRRMEDELYPVRDQMGRSLNRAKIDSEEMGLFLRARGAALRRANVSKINPDLVAQSPEAGAGMSDADAAALMSGGTLSNGEVVNGFKNGPRYAKFVDIAKQYDKINEDTLRMRVESGDLSQEQADAMRKAYSPESAAALGLADPDGGYASYFTHYRTAPSPEDSTGLGTGVGTSGQPVKRALGRTSQADNPLMFALMDRQNAIIRAEKIRVNQGIAAEVRRIGDDNFARVETLPTKPQINSSTGLVEDLPDPTWMSRPEVLPFKENGKTHAIVFNKDLTYVPQVLRGETLSNPVPYVAPFSRAFGSFWTRSSPLFPIKNLVKDVPRTLLFSYARYGVRFAANVAKQWPTALRDMNRSLVGHADVPADVGEFLNSGAPVATYGYDDYTATAKQLQSAIDRGDKAATMVGVLRFVQHVNDAFENATRLAAYRAARAKNFNVQEAARISKEKVNLDFERRGNIGPALNSLWTFSNANIQDTAAIAGLLKEAKSNKRVLGALTGLVTLGAAIDSGSRLLSSEDENGDNKYDKGVSESTKHRGLTLGLGDSYVRLPMQQGLNFFTDIGRHMSEVAWGARSPQEAAWLATANLADVVSPIGTGPVEQAMTPTAGDMIVQLGTNKSFTGSPIVPEQSDFPTQPQKPGSQNHWRETPQPYVALAQAMAKLTTTDDSGRGKVEVPPDLIRWFVSQLGGWGKLADQSMSTGSKIAAGQDIEPRDIPILSDFMGKPSDRYIDQEYAKSERDIANKVDRYKQLQNEDPKRAQAWLDANPGLQQQYERMKFINKHLEDIPNTLENERIRRSWKAKLKNPQP